jgi:hemin uptake protein HemP
MRRTLNSRDELKESGVKPATGPKSAAPVISSRDLLAGHREVTIQHGEEQYRLLLTGSNKLILIK